MRTRRILIPAMLLASIAIISMYAAWPARRLQPGDWVRVTVPDPYTPGVEIAREGQVRFDGGVRVPLSGMHRVAGKTVAEFRQVLFLSFQRPNLPSSPEVDVAFLRRGTARGSLGQDQLIQAGDLLSIDVKDLVATGCGPPIEVVCIGDAVALPLVGQIKAAGLTEAELEEKITSVYAAAKIIEKAYVAVEILPPGTKEWTRTTARPWPFN